jgi:hypothetical protein
MLVSVAVAFLAAAVEPSVAPAQAPAAIAKPKRICRVEEAVTGSLTPKRVCVTVPAEASMAKPGQAAPASDKAQASGRPENGSSN